MITRMVELANDAARRQKLLIQQILDVFSAEASSLEKLAIVPGAADKGTWARPLTPPVEGRIVRGFQGLAVGQKVRVRLLSTDVSRGFIDFAREG